MSPRGALHEAIGPMLDALVEGACPGQAAGASHGQRDPNAKPQKRAGETFGQPGAQEHRDQTGLVQS